MSTKYLPENMQGVFLRSPKNLQRVCLIYHMVQPTAKSSNILGHD